jgi:transposase
MIRICTTSPTFALTSESWIASMCSTFFPPTSNTTSPNNTPEQQLRILAIRLLLAHSPGANLRRVPDPQLELRLMVEDRFPRIWVADAENRDLRQLLWHRHRLVQMRTRVMNQLHVVALNEGLRRKKALWRSAGRNQLESLKLAPWASRRRQDLLDLLDQLTPKIQELTRALEEEVESGR